MSPSTIRRAAAIAAILSIASIAFPLAWWSPADDPPNPNVDPEARPDRLAARVLERLVPDIPNSTLLKLGRPDPAEAVAELEQLVADEEKTDPDDRAFLRLIQATALRASGDLPAAADKLRAGIAAAPAGKWTAKLRYDLAAVELASGSPADAQALGRELASALLDPDRKDRLALVYRGFARETLRPDNPIASPDHETGHRFLEEARGVAKGRALRADLLFEMAEASAKAGQHGRARDEYRRFLDENPDDPRKYEARDRLAQALLDGGDPLRARLAWTDLARELRDDPDPARVAIRRAALYKIAGTHARPGGRHDASTAYPAIAALERYLETAPDGADAVSAAFQLAEFRDQAGNLEDALAAYRDFLEGKRFRAVGDDALRALETLNRRAMIRVAEILRAREDFDAAETAYRAYLAAHPNGPQAADAQKALVDLKLERANLRRAEKRHDDARDAWNAFVRENPIDPRVPEVLRLLGETLVDEKRFDDALAAWEILFARFPGSEPAEHAKYQAGFLLENELGRPESAIERYREIQLSPWRENALARVAAMEARELVVSTPRVYRIGETPKLKIRTRNLPSLTFTVHKLDPESYFRKKRTLSGVESLDIALVAPDAEWKLDVPGHARYVPVEREYDIRAELPGVFVVKVTDETHLQSTTLVVGGDLDAIVKTSKDQLLVFARDMRTGAGRPGARVLAADGERVVFEGVTGPDGVLLADWPEPRVPGRPLSFLALHESGVAAVGFPLTDSVAVGLAPRAAIYTDRPLYRPGAEVRIRGIVRETVDGRYAFKPGEIYQLEVIDPRGRALTREPVALSPFGTFHKSIRVDDAAPVGTYAVRLQRPGAPEFNASFEVAEYELQKVELVVELARAVHMRGEPVKGRVLARNRFGTPLADRPVVVRLPDGRLLEGRADAEGAFPFEFETGDYAETQLLEIRAALPDDGVSARAFATLAVRAFSIALDIPRDVHLPGETVQVNHVVRDAAGAPIAEPFELRLLKRFRAANRVGEREISRLKAETGPDGRGRSALTIPADDAEGGEYVLRAHAVDRFGNIVVAERTFQVSGADDPEKLRFLVERTAFKVGETPQIRLHARGGSGLGLLVWEADRILKYRLVPIVEGDNAVSWEVAPEEFPNFTLTASRMIDNRFDEARLDLRVERDLAVELIPDKPRVGPGEPIRLKVKTTDQLGRPAPAELSIAMIDEALLSLRPDAAPPLASIFHDRSRTAAFSTRSTNTFSYNPPTAEVPRAVVDERERQAAQLANRASREEVMDKLAEMGNAVPTPAAPPAPAPAAAAPEPTAGFFGGMGGARPESLARRAAPARKAMADRDADMPREEAEMENRPEDAAFPLADEKAGAGRFRGAEAPARERFVETAHWSPAVVTDADGLAELTIDAPSALSSYRLRAAGVTAADTLVGEAAVTVAVRKDFLVDLKAPTFLNQGDKPRLRAEVHHVGARGPVTVELKVYADGREAVFPARFEATADGITEVLFDPFEVPADRSVRLEIVARAGELEDRVVEEVPIRSRGARIFATASGASRSDALVKLGLPAGRTFARPEMVVTLAPTANRLVLEIALGAGNVPDPILYGRCVPPMFPTVADRASDLLAAVVALDHLRAANLGDAPDAARLRSRALSLVSELVGLQTNDGGWPWIGARAGAGQPSHPDTTAIAYWALAAAERFGLLPDDGPLQRGEARLNADFAAERATLNLRAAILHALSVRNKATFEAANSLNRERARMGSAALARLALTFANLQRPTLAAEVLDALARSVVLEPGLPGAGPGGARWPGDSEVGEVESTALAALAFAESRPTSELVPRAADWLLSRRIGLDWRPARVKGPALAVVARSMGPARAAADRYALALKVNGEIVQRLEIAGPAETRVIAVPDRLLKPAGENTVEFDVEGRGLFAYSIALAGFTADIAPEREPRGKPFVVRERAQLAAPRIFEGRPLPQGFASVLTDEPYANPARAVPRGGAVRVEISVQRTDVADPADPRRRDDYLIVREPIPAGARVLEETVSSNAVHREIGDGEIRWYFAPGVSPGPLTYEMVGVLPGEYRVPPARVESFAAPDRVHFGPEGALTVLPPGVESDDPYKPTPDELLALGKRLHDSGRIAESVKPLEELIDNHNLRPEPLVEVARMLLLAQTREANPRGIVKYFEILRERAPGDELPFDRIVKVGDAYAAIGENERAFLVWRAVIDSAYVEDARVARALRDRGRNLEAVRLLLELWRESPDTEAIAADFFGLSQWIAKLAADSIDDPATRREFADAGVTRSRALLQAVRLARAYLARSLNNPMADEAAISLLGNLLDLGDFEGVVPLARGFAERRADSPFMDGFRYAQTVALFQLGRLDDAIELAKAIAEATYPDPSGIPQPGPNKWNALYILGQIHEARLRPDLAVEYYGMVKDRFGDAAMAWNWYTRAELKLPEVSLLRPVKDETGALKVVEPVVKLEHRNVAKVEIKVYPVDLVRLYLSKRDLSGVAQVDLAGIKPLLQREIELGDGKDYADRTTEIPIPVDREGAYLVLVRGGELYASGIALVTPLELLAQEEPAAGRVRVIVRDAATRAPMPKVQVRVLGSANPDFLVGETDPRGVFVAEGVRGRVTALARLDQRYAFHRGTVPVGPIPEPTPMPGQGQADPASNNLYMELRQQNSINQMRQLERFNERFDAPSSGVQIQKTQ